jgi:hypothetical protein
MPATWSTIQGALKEVWTDDRLVSQLYEETPFLSMIERTNKYNIGEYAVTPITEYRNGGVTVTDSSGSSALNPAGNVGVRQAQYGLVLDFGQVKIELGAILSSGSNAQSVAEVIDLETTSATAEVRKQKNRQLFGDQSGLIAQCGTTSTSATVVLDTANAAGLTGFQALQRDWLHPTQTIDLGTTSNPTSIAAGRTITAVSESSSSPTITISGATVSTDNTIYVSLSGSRSGSTSKESNGLRNIISTSAALGGLTAGGKLQAAGVSTATDLTVGILNDMNRQVRMHTGGLRDNKSGYNVFASYLQMQRLYDQLQNQVRFDGDKSIDAGGFEYVKYNGMEIYSEPDIRDSDVFFINTDDLFLATGSGAGFGSAGWLNNTGGAPSMGWAQGTSAFTDGYFMTGNLAAKRRNRMAGFYSLT